MLREFYVSIYFFFVIGYTIITIIAEATGSPCSLNTLPVTVRPFVRVSTCLSARALSSAWGGDVQANLIEGDEIYLENTRADVVRGKQIEIGPNCKIKLIEYSESLKVHDDSDVEKQTKI